MNTDQKIHQAFNKVKLKVNDNYYIPGVKSTVFPEEKLSFNEFSKFIHNEVRKTYSNNNLK